MENGDNPFTPGSGLDPPYLAGREGELRMFEDMLRRVERGRVRNIMLYGLRGVGKTVLLSRFASVCRDNGFLALTRYQYSLKDSNPDMFTDNIKHVLRSAVESHSKIESVKGKLRLAKEYIKPSAVGVPGIVYYEPSYSHDRKVPLVDHLIDYLVKNWKIIDELGHKGAIFLFDEFHMISDVKKNQWYALADFLGAVNEVQKQGYKYSLVLSGLPMMLKNVKTARSYTERMFTLMELSNLSKDDGRRAIVRPLADVDRSFSPRLVDAIIEDAGGYPYFIQFIACEVLQRFERKKIGLSEYKSVRSDLISNLRSDFFDQRMVDLTSREKKTLYLMSRVPEADMEFSSILNATGYNKGVLSSHLKRLEDKGIIYRHNRGHYRFALPMLKPYLDSVHAGRS